MKLRLHRTPVLMVFLCWALSTTVTQAQKENSPLDKRGGERTKPAGPDREAIELVRDILAQRPDQPTVMTGTLKIRDGEGRRREIPLKYTMEVQPGGWRGIYETQATPQRGAERLVIIHRRDAPNEYIHSGPARPGAAPGKPVTYAAGRAARPFAGSEYWLSDLGLEFLHWPEPRLLRDAKLKMRSGRAVRVLECTNPRPAPDDYARVVVSLDVETGTPIHAEGFDAAGKRCKIFSLHGIAKTNGQWQPKSLEMLNETTDAKTSIEFTDLD